LIWLIVGLGNPGKRYQLTRHNIGFLVVDRFAQKNGIFLNEKRGGAQIGRGIVVGNEVVIAKPLRYMNRSGRQVLKLIEELKISLNHLLVIHDDLDLQFGQIRIKQRGGHGGHKGVKSIMESLQGDEFMRLKVGIDKPEDPEKTQEFVLTPFSHYEKFLLDERVERVVEAIEAILLDGIEKAMNMYN
jgi:PTH1 family peptidyl-tRNA hydrolase